MYSLAILLCTLSATPLPADAATEVIHPELRRRMENARPGEALDCYAVLRDRLELEDLEARVRGLDPRARRRAVVQALKEHAGAEQQDLMGLLRKDSTTAGCGSTSPCGWATPSCSTPRARSSRRWRGSPRSTAFRPVAAVSPDEVLDGFEAGGGLSPEAPADVPESAASSYSSIEPNITQLQAPQLWDLGFDGTGMLLGIIDFGTDYSVPDLADHIWSNPGEIPGNLVDDDGNGYVDDMVGWDFFEDDNDPTEPTVHHGTLAAGLAVGDGTGGLTTGMAGEATLVVCRVVYEPEYWEAQQYLIEVGVDVITTSLSYKWPQNPRPDYFLHRQICDMELAAGIIHTNSISNNGNFLGAYPIPFNIGVPGNCPSPFLHPEQSGGRPARWSPAPGSTSRTTPVPEVGTGPRHLGGHHSLGPGLSHAQDSGLWDYPFGGFSGTQPGLLETGHRGLHRHRDLDPHRWRLLDVRRDLGVDPSGGRRNGAPATGAAQRPCPVIWTRRCS